MLGVVATCLMAGKAVGDIAVGHHSHYDHVAVGVEVGEEVEDGG